MSIYHRIFFLFAVLLSGPASAVANEASVSDTLFHEITNGRTLHLFPAFPALHLPGGMTAHLFMVFLAAGLIISLFLYASRKASLKPSGSVLIVESLILFVQNDIVFPIMGKERGEKWLPFFCQLFTFLLAVNLLGLIPAFKSATGNINVTTSLSAMVLILIFVMGVKALGVGHFFKNLYPEGMAWPIGIFVFFLEFIGIFIKAGVLSLRLFANMFAGHLAILSFLMLIFLFNPWAGVLAVPFSVFIYVLEVLICLIQALVFTLLSCIFITMASSAH